MNYEEEIKKLEQKLDRLASLQIDTEMKLQRFIDGTERLSQSVEKMNNGLDRFAVIVMDHENRIDRLEGNSL